MARGAASGPTVRLKPRSLGGEDNDHAASRQPCAGHLRNGDCGMLKALLSAIFFGALVVCVCALIHWTSLDFQECIKSYEENNPAADHLKKGISAFIDHFPSYRHCVGAYVTDKNPVITAVCIENLIRFDCVAESHNVSEWSR
jgi:hypothetical protein